MAAIALVWVAILLGVLVVSGFLGALLGVVFECGVLLGKVVCAGALLGVFGFIAYKVFVWFCNL